MKKRLIPVLTIGAIIMIGSIVYASDKKKQAKHLVTPTDPVREEALMVELLQAVDDHDNKVHDAGKPGKVDSKKVDKEIDESGSRK